MSNSKKFLDYGGLQKYDELMKEYVSEHGGTGGQSDWTESDSDDPSYIKNKPTLGTASAKDVPTTGDASTSQVVMGNDSRLSDSRPASDVSSWAKASTKPTYTASEVGAIATTAKGANNGVAELDSTGKVPSSQLPSYVDDVEEYNSLSNFPATGESGKIYIAKDTNKTYRWSGTAYVEISPSLALGETESTAYRGDRGKAAYDHSQVVTGNPHNVTASDVGLGNVGNFKAVSTVANQGLTDTEKSNARANIGAGTGSGTITEIKTTAGAHTTVDTTSGKAEFNVPTNTSHLTNDSGFLTSHQTIKQDGITGATINRYGTCSTLGNVAEKVVDITSGTFSLENGTTIVVKFHFENTAWNPTLNVNSTGAKSIQTNGGTTIYSGEYISLLKGTVMFVYNAGSWWIIGNYFNDKVTLTNSTANSNYRLLLGDISDNTVTTGANKSANFTANPSTGNMTIGGQLTDKWGLQSIRPMTRDAYNALSYAEKHNGTYYHLTDVNTVPSLDCNVSQTPTTANKAYRVLLSGSDNDTDSVEGTLKNSNLTYNPYTQALTSTRTTTSSGTTINYYNMLLPDHLDLQKYTNGVLEQIQVKPTDIYYSGKWDGTNTSLKTAVSSLNSALSDFGKEFEKSGSTARAFIESVMSEVKSYADSKGYKIFMFNVNWTSNNTGFGTYSSTRRFFIQIGDSQYFGIMTTTGTIAQLRQVTTTSA